ncbi:hypothetical protein VTP01DRAFT_9943 [Rhizomucor pusillus]|uniref:uncharacterized protein n=1 Tax=Rhizomucor pusillus TaxID=4840 RepID=UPI00374354A1
MGLGKTIQTIGLIASTMQTPEAKRRTTLVVTPLALVRQWAREIAAKTDPGTINVLIYHGPNRAKDASKFFDYDVVITTYQVVASDLPNKESSKDRTKLEDILKSETSSVCTEEEIDTASSSTQQTRGPLLQFDWYRVVLDEAQYIKNRATRSAISCTELSAQKRWCLTGTPMQNNVDELYSLFRFLRIKPLSEYHTFKDTISIPMQSGRVDTALERLKVVLMAVMLRRTKQIFKVDGDSCNTSSPSSTSSGVSEAESTSDNSPSVSTQLAVKLPPRDKTDIVLTFSPEERRLYDLLSTRMRRTVKEILQAGKGTRNYMNMLCMILRLRQACDHPQLVLSILKDSDDAIALATEGNGAGNKKPSSSSSTDAASQRVLIEKLASDLGWQGAGMLGQSVFDKASSDSNVICDLCGRVIPFADSIGSFCAMCKEQINQYAAYSLVKQDSRLTSTKVSKTLEILQDIQRESPGEKTVIFSQFTSMLDLMQEPLRQSGIKFCRYDGSMPNYLREKSLVTLQKDPECTVMLISLKCGSLGLNLTAANRVILLDIWWNPAVEEQAIDRVHRIGQTLPVRVVRLMIDNTIEEKIVKLQQKKAQMVHGVLGDGIVRNTKLTMEEIRALFDL